MLLHLPPWRHACLTNDDLVVLDVRADRYAALPAVGGQLQLSDGGATARLADAGLAPRLRALGFDAAEPRSRRPCAVLPSAAAGPQLDATPIRFSAFFAARLALAAARYAASPFQSLIEVETRVAAPRLRTPQADRAVAVAQAFRRWRTWTPHTGKCLFRAFVLRQLLLAEGIRPAWVFGVKTWPFAAHCWLQLSDLVLDDEPERVLRFTPILVA